MPSQDRLGARFVLGGEPVRPRTDDRNSPRHQGRDQWLRASKPSAVRKGQQARPPTKCFQVCRAPHDLFIGGYVGVGQGCKHAGDRVLVTPAVERVGLGRAQHGHP